MSLFVIGDTHLSFGVDKPMDIFGGWQDYTDRLEKNWRGIVGDTDTVVIPGDISWAMSLADAEADFAFLHALPGHKIILKGNHDYWWNTMRKMQAFLTEKGFDSIAILHNNTYEVGDFALCGSRGWFFDAGEADKKVILREAARLERSIEAAEATGKEPIAFLHYPPLMGTQCCEEILDVLLRHKIKRCFYGHLHGESARKSRKETVEGMEISLVSADFLDFYPKLIEKI